MISPKHITIAAALALGAAGAAYAGPECEPRPQSEWLPSAAALTHLTLARGYEVREFEIDDGCYRIEGRDPSGQRVEAYFDPKTLALVRSEQDD